MRFCKERSEERCFLRNIFISGITFLFSSIFLTSKKTKDELNFFSDETKDSLFGLKDDLKDKSIDFKEKILEIQDSLYYFVEGFSYVLSEYKEEINYALSPVIKNFQESFKVAYSTGKESFLRKKKELESQT
jgi:hypothetical protein